MKKKRKKTMEWLVIALAAVTVAVVIGVVVFLYGSPAAGKAGKLNDFTVIDEDNPNLGLRLNAEGLELQQVGIYNGPFVEDGSDEEVKNVAALTVKNTSDQMLQIAEIECRIDKTDARFQVTNLPAGATALILELDRKEISKISTVENLSVGTVFLEEVSMEKDKVETEGKDGLLTLKNISDEELPQVYVYYKNKQSSDFYLGGITYRSYFEHVPAKTQVETDAGHYKEKTSAILNIQILDNQN